MDAISNAATAVKEAVWGTNDPNGSGEEPQSGVQGNPAKGEPFDGGNIEPQTGGDSGPTATTGSSIAPGDSTKAQNDTRDPSNPQTEPENADAKKDVNNNGAPQVDGPGPKPIAIVAEEHGGDAGNSDQQDEAHPGQNGVDGTTKDDEAEDGLRKTSNDEGTGERHVKSTGLKADGGDFDAAKAGAGREADRLLEQKGLHRDDHHKPCVTDEKSPSPDVKGKEKKSLGQKIKDKLHRTNGS